MYRIEVTAAAARQLRKLDSGARKSLQVRLGELAANPRPPGSVKLVGEQTAWRIRVGDYRVIYDIFDDALVIVVVAVGHRREVYRSR